MSTGRKEKLNGKLLKVKLSNQNINHAQGLGLRFAKMGTAACTKMGDPQLLRIATVCLISRLGRILNGKTKLSSLDIHEVELFLLLL